MVRYTKSFEQFLRDARSTALVGAGQQQYELITTQASYRIVFAHDGTQPLANLHQQRVAYAVAE